MGCIWHWGKVESNQRQSYKICGELRVLRELDTLTQHWHKRNSEREKVRERRDLDLLEKKGIRRVGKSENRQISLDQASAMTHLLGLLTLLICLGIGHMGVLGAPSSWVGSLYESTDRQYHINHIISYYGLLTSSSHKTVMLTMRKVSKWN